MLMRVLGFTGKAVLIIVNTLLLIAIHFCSMQSAVAKGQSAVVTFNPVCIKLEFWQRIEAPVATVFGFAARVVKLDTGVAVKQ